jgi:glycosyltransferase involved in cell wall biosynthesis
MSRFLVIAYTSYVRDGRVKRHAEALAGRGDEVDVICLGSDQLHSANGVNLIGIEMPRYRGSNRAAYMRSYLRFFTRAAAIALRRSIAARYDAALVCSMPDAVVVCAVALKLLGTRLILDVHDTMPELYLNKFSGRRGAFGARLLQLEERASALIANRVLAVHDLHRIRLEAAGIPAEKIRVVLNSPDPRIFSSLDGRRTRTEFFTLVCHGTITRRLGLDVAFQAIDLLRETIPTLRLMVIGDGDYLPAARDLVAQMRLDDEVNFLAPVPIEKLPAVLEQADVGIVPNQPSAATHLMLPVKMMEYATLGIPIIAARLRTIEHYFGDDAALLFKPGDAGALADAIENLYANRERAAALARRASRVADKLSWMHQREHFFAAIDDLLPRKRATGSQAAQPHEMERTDDAHAPTRSDR